MLGSLRVEGRGGAGLLSALTAALLLALTAAGCRQMQDAAGLSVRPKSLRDVPAERLSFRFEPDAKEDALPERLRSDDAEEPMPGVKAAFETQRTTDALIRTVPDPAGMRALALYGTSDTSAGNSDFRIDLYSAEGVFVRNVLPRDLTGVFPAEVAWSPDSQMFAFSGIRNPNATPTPTLDAALPPDPAAAPPVAPDMPESVPTPAAPLIPSVHTFKTEQVTWRTATASSCGPSPRAKGSYTSSSRGRPTGDNSPRSRARRTSTARA